ncbi:MAG: hypothetical protein RR951_01170 [Ruthenibacterium sp.]
MMEKTLRQKKNHPFVAKLVLFLLVTFCFAAVFTDNWLKTSLRDWQHDSEGNAIGRVYQMQLGLDNPSGLMLTAPDADLHATEHKFLSDSPLDELRLYWHQPGLQGFVYGLLNKALCALGQPPLLRLSALYFATIWAFFVTFGAVCFWFYREFGLAAALLGGIGTLCSAWTLKSIGNLYWVTALYFLPFVLCAFVCRRYETAHSIPLRACLLIAAGVFLRFLCGFEFTPTTLICMEAPLMYYWAKHPHDTKKWLRAALCAGLLSLAAFAVAFGIWMTQMAIGFGSWTEAYKEMLFPIAIRTGLISNVEIPAGELADSLTMSIPNIIQTYLQGAPMLGTLTMQTLLLLYAALTAAAMALCAVLHDRAKLLCHAQLLVLCAIALLAPMSWFVMGRGHAAIHTHIDYILWLFPLLPCMLAHMGYSLHTCRELLAVRRILVQKTAQAGGAK